MKRIVYMILVCTGLLLSMACTHEELEKTYLQLQLAEKTVDQDPKEALRLLAGIGDPEALGRDEFMRYVVIRTQAKYMDYQDIAKDTLIITAQQFFADHNNPEMAARASFYTACFYDENKMQKQKLEYCLKALHYAKLSDNRLFEAKSLYLSGSIYYVQEMKDSAQVNYQQALELYRKLGNSSNSELELLFMLGRVTQDIGQDSEKALQYYQEGLELARKINNESYEAQILRNIGIIYRDQQQYTQAKVYYAEALTKKQNPDDVLRIYLNYAHLYRTINQRDSVRYYLNAVNSQISEIKYPYTRRNVFKNLSEYYEQESNIEEVKRYYQLMLAEELIIQKSINQEEMLLVAAEFEAFKQEAEQTHSQMLLIGLVGAVVLTSVSGIIGLQLKKKKRNLRRSQSWQRVNEHFQAKKAAECHQWTQHEEEEYCELFSKHYPNVPIETIREIFVKQHAVINDLFAERSRQLIQEFHQGSEALKHLSSEDLCFMHLYQTGYSDELITRIMCYPFYLQKYMDSRWQAMRDVMKKAGMRDEDINELIPKRSNNQSQERILFSKSS